VNHITAFFLNLRKAGVETEFHVYAGIGHGFGIRPINPPSVNVWPTRFVAWLGNRGFLAAARSISLAGLSRGLERDRLLVELIEEAPSVPGQDRRSHHAIEAVDIPHLGLRGHFLHATKLDAILGARDLNPLGVPTHPGTRFEQHQFSRGQFGLSFFPAIARREGINHARAHGTWRRGLGSPVDIVPAENR